MKDRLVGFLCLFLVASASAKETAQSMNASTQLKSDVRALTDFGERNTKNPKGLHLAAEWLHRSLARMGYEVTEQEFLVDDVRCQNIVAAAPGFDRKKPHLLIGAHYDSAPGTPGADDNASGVAVLLALARRFADSDHRDRLRFVAFANEEPPYFRTEFMGSHVFARDCSKAGDHITAMICLESLGIFYHKPGTQRLPIDPAALDLPRGSDPTVGNFVGIVGNGASMKWAEQFAQEFNRSVPAIAVKMPQMTLSDHVSFWEEGFEAIMLTDTALFRSPHYHRASDTAEKLDYKRMAETARAICNAITHWLKQD